MIFPAILRTLGGRRIFQKTLPAHDLALSPSTLKGYQPPYFRVSLLDYLKNILNGTELGLFRYDISR